MNFSTSRPVFILVMDDTSHTALCSKHTNNRTISPWLSGSSVNLYGFLDALLECMSVLFGRTGSHNQGRLDLQSLIAVFTHHRTRRSPNCATTNAWVHSRYFSSTAFHVISQNLLHSQVRFIHFCCYYDEGDYYYYFPTMPHHRQRQMLAVGDICGSAIFPKSSENSFTSNSTGFFPLCLRRFLP